MKITEKTKDWQYFIDPVCPDLAQHIAQTGSEQPALNADIEEMSLVYRKKTFPVYRVQEGFFNLLYQGRSKYLGTYKHRMRFFKREGQYGAIHLINYQELKSAAKRASNKAIKIAVNNKQTVSKHS